MRPSEENDGGGERVRVWWEPTDSKSKDGFAGAYWPAKVLSRQSKKITVQYDNGDQEQVSQIHVSDITSLPYDFGQEEGDLQPGEFCEVFNGSETDPCAWFGRVVKKIKGGPYVVEYPFHSAKPERIEPKMIRRARVMEDDEWRLVKPHQVWEDGEVLSPRDLVLIHEDELEDCLQEKPARKAKPKRASPPAKEAPEPDDEDAANPDDDDAPEPDDDADDPDADSDPESDSSEDEPAAKRTRGRSRKSSPRRSQEAAGSPPGPLSPPAPPALPGVHKGPQASPGAEEPL